MSICVLQCCGMNGQVTYFDHTRTLLVRASSSILNILNEVQKFCAAPVKYTTGKGLVNFAEWSQHRQITDRRRTVFDLRKCRLQ